MRKHVNLIHSLGLRLLGTCVLLYFFGIVAGVAHGLANDRPIALNVSVGLICGSLCIYFLLPKTMPGWLRNPINATEAFAIFFCLVVALLFVMGPMAGVAVAAFEPPVAVLQYYIVMALIPAAAASVGVALSGAVLAFLPAPARSKEPAEESHAYENEWRGIEEMVLDNDVPALHSVRMMRLSRT